MGFALRRCIFQAPHPDSDRNVNVQDTSISILVVGAGAIGGITAAFLKKGGCNVEIIDAFGDYASHISRNGLTVRGAQGAFTIAIHAYSDPSQVPGRKDLVILATKAAETSRAAAGILPLLSNEGRIVALQNGMGVEELAPVVGRDRLICCVVGWGATMEQPGQLLMSSKGDFIIGYPYRERDEFLETVGRVMSAVVPVKTTGNILGHMYAKLIVNSCITSLGAVCGLYLGEMLANRKVRRVFIEIIREAFAVADAARIEIEPFKDKLDFPEFLRGSGYLADLRRHMVIRGIGYQYRKLKSSSLQSLQRGQPTEVQYLNGYITRKGEELGVPVPVNSAVISIIQEIEGGQRTSSIQNFDHTAFAAFN